MKQPEVKKSNGGKLIANKAKVALIKAAKAKGNQ